MRLHSKLLAATAILFATAALPAAAQAEDAIAQHSGTLYAGPGSDFPAVDHISRGDGLQVYGCTDGYDWCDVSDGDNRGWFPGSRIAYMRDGSEVFLPAVATVVGIGIIGFAVDDYWGAHYHSRPFFHQEHVFASRYHGPGPGFHGPAPVVHNNVVIQNNNPVVHNNPIVHNNVVIHNNNPVVHNNPVVQNKLVVHNNNGFHPNVVHNTPVVHNNPVVHQQHTVPVCPQGKCH